MRIAAVAMLLAVLVAFAGFAYAQDPTQSHSQGRLVSVAVTTASVRVTIGTRSDVLLLWNRNERTTPIGHALKSCIRARSLDVFGEGLMGCTMTLSLPLGKITASGIVHNLRRYTLVITGGTGVYQGVTGPLFVRSETGAGVRRLTFTL